MGINPNLYSFNTLPGKLFFCKNRIPESVTALDGNLTLIFETFGTTAPAPYVKITAVLFKDKYWSGSILQTWNPSPQG